jgi:hypothetical protein
MKNKEIKVDGNVGGNPNPEHKLESVGSCGIQGKTPEHKLDVNPKKVEKFELKEENYNALVESNLELKKNLLNLQDKFEAFRLEIRFEHGADEYKGKYFVYYDEPTDKTYIQDIDIDEVFGFEGCLTSAEVLKEYLNDKD